MKQRSIIARLAATYTLAFALAVVVLGVLVLVTTRTASRREFDARVRTEAASLVQEYDSEGLTDVVEAVRERDRTPGALDYGLADASGRPVVGWLATVRSPLGWTTRDLVQPGGAAERVRFWTTRLPKGELLIVGDDLRRIEALDRTVLAGFAIALLGVVTLGLAGGHFLSRGERRRFLAITEVADAVSGGDLSRRAPVRGPADDLDDLALTFNRMLDRIGDLLESLRQVSNDIAHDLRTPLTRVRQRLEAAQRATDPEAKTAAIDAAMGDLDGALQTFAALLRISQIEAGARRAGMKPVDLADLSRAMVETFAPSAEESGRHLAYHGPARAMIQGDAELLTQMLVNLIENGLRHTPDGSHIDVTVAEQGADILLRVSDDGPGIPAAERARVFDRFFRLEESRSTPGSGLGLALVAAVAKLHLTQPQASDAEPGFAVELRFARTSP